MMEKNNTFLSIFAGQHVTLPQSGKIHTRAFIDAFDPMMICVRAHGFRQSALASFHLGCDAQLQHFNQSRSHESTPPNNIYTSEMRYTPGSADFLQKPFRFTSHQS